MAVLSRDAAVPGDRATDLTRVLASPWMLAAILLAAFMAYAPTLNDWFTGDDFWFLRAGQTSSFGEYLVRAFDPRETGVYPELNRYRPLYAFAWWLQYQAFGLNAMPYHAVVLALHLACIVMAWWVFRRLLGPGAMANFATMIFALHPAYAEAIAWLSGGNRVFAVAPALASLLLYMKSEDAGAPRVPLLAGSFALYVVAILMHSSLVMLAPVLAAYTFLIRGEPRSALSWRRWLPLVPFFAVAAGSFLVQRWVRDHIGVDDGFSFGFHIYANYGSYFALVLVPFRNPGSTSDAVATIKLIASVVVLAVVLAIAFRRPLWGRRSLCRPLVARVAPPRHDLRDRRHGPRHVQRGRRRGPPCRAHRPLRRGAAPLRCPRPRHLRRPNRRARTGRCARRDVLRPYARYVRAGPGVSRLRRGAEGERQATT